MSTTPLRPDAAGWLRLCLVPGISTTMQRALLRAFGSPEAALAAGPAAVAEVIGEAPAQGLAAGPPAAAFEQALTWIGHPGHHLITLADATFPAELLQLPDPPTVLFVRGDLRLLNRPAIAIVGSRNATRQGLIDARSFARLLSDAGFTIVSGLALGIDAAAHRGGLEGGASSIAVIATGPDRVYPPANRPLAHELAQRGALVSEFVPGTPPVAHNFPRRNRIISGLARGVLVVEGAMKSGSLITARLGAEQGKEVFAIPGSIHCPQSRGCHWLIKQGAKLVDCAQDIMDELGIPGAPATVAQAERSCGDALDPLLAALGHSPATLDVLSLRTGRPAADLAAELTRLELAQRIERLPGGLYRQLVTAT